VNKAFEQIALIEGLIAAAFFSEEKKLLGWCANSAISPDNLSFIAETCAVILSANRAEQRAATLGAIAFGARTLVFRECTTGLFIAYLDSPTNDAVLVWLFDQVTPLLVAEGVALA
jgi:hypothetical protein